MSCERVAARAGSGAQQQIRVACLKTWTRVVFAEMTSTVAKRAAPNVPPKAAPRRSLASDGAAVVTGNGSAVGGHVVTSSSASSSAADEPVQLTAELPDGRRVSLVVDARSYSRAGSLHLSPRPNSRTSVRSQSLRPD